MEATGHGLGTIRKDFLDEPELEMVEFMPENFIVQGRLFGGSDFKLLTRQCSPNTF
jgi:hypothetical protein